MKNMFGKLVTLSVLLFLIFIAIGDALPLPLRQASLQTRATLNAWMVNLIPSWEPKTKPYKRTEEALKEEEQRVRGQ
ncbi:hypothetical protein [Trichothermofontia sp.]